MRYWLCFLALLFISCASYQVMYVQGEAEKKAFLKQLEEQHATHIEVKKGSQGIYVIRYKEGKE